MLPRPGLRALAFLLSLSAAACSSNPPVTLRFRATVGGTDFACGQSYPMIGRTGATLVASDYRFFVTNIRLVDAAGHETPVAIEDDGIFQTHEVALLDFENHGPTCSVGTAETHLAVTGTAPAGTYTGIRFQVGIPFAANHADSATAPSPLNLSGMYWDWNQGHKFLRFDARVGSTTGTPSTLHLGSTGCVSLSGTPQMCAHENLVDVALDGFDPRTGTIVADVARVLAGSDVTMDTPSTGPGCQSEESDPDCAPVFARLGLPFGAAPASGMQQLFHAE